MGNFRLGKINQFGDEHGLGVNDCRHESVEVIKGPDLFVILGSDLPLGPVLIYSLIQRKFRRLPKKNRGRDLNLNYIPNTKD